MKKGIRIAVLVAAGVLLTVIVFMLLDRCQRAPGNGAPGPAASPTPELTEAQALARELIEDEGRVAYSRDECDSVYLRGSQTCIVLHYATEVSLPPWEELLPATEFFLVRARVYFAGLPDVESERHNYLIVDHGGRRYDLDSFDELLVANGVTAITDENRELVAQAIALMGLEEYLEDEVSLSPLEEGDWEGRFGRRLNYALTAWTRIQGLVFHWRFRFEDGTLRMAERYQRGSWRGDYVEVSADELPIPLATRPETYYY
jgi:hypothetical protein